MVSGRLVTGASSGVPLGSLSSWVSLLEVGRELPRELQRTGPACCNAPALAATKCKRAPSARPSFPALRASWALQRRELHGACERHLGAGPGPPAQQEQQQQPCRAYTDGARPSEADDLSRLAREWQRLSLATSVKRCTVNDSNSLTGATQMTSTAPRGCGLGTTCGPAPLGAKPDGAAAGMSLTLRSGAIPLRLVEATCALLDWRHSHAVSARGPYRHTGTAAAVAALDPGSAAAVADIISAAASCYHSDTTAGLPPPDLARSLVAAATAVAQTAPWAQATRILNGLVQMGTIGTRYLDWTLVRIQQIPTTPKPSRASRSGGCCGGQTWARERSWRGDRWGTASSGPAAGAPAPPPPGFQVDPGPSAAEAVSLLTSLSVVHGVQGGGAARNTPLAMLRLMQHLQARLHELPGPAALMPLLHAVTSCGWRHDREPGFLRSVGDYLSAPGPAAGPLERSSGEAITAAVAAAAPSARGVTDPRGFGDEEGLVGRARLLALTPAQLVAVLDAYRRAGVHHSGLLERALDAAERCLPAFTTSQAARLAETCARFSHFRPGLMRRLAHHVGAHLPAAAAPGDVAAVVTSLARCRVREDRVMGVMAAYAAEHTAAWSARLQAAGHMQAAGLREATAAVGEQAAAGLAQPRADTAAGGRECGRGREIPLGSPSREPAAQAGAHGIRGTGTPVQRRHSSGAPGVDAGVEDVAIIPARRIECGAASASGGKSGGQAPSTQPCVAVGLQGAEQLTSRDDAAAGSRRGIDQGPKVPHWRQGEGCTAGGGQPGPQSSPGVGGTLGAGGEAGGARVPPAGLLGGSPRPARHTSPDESTSDSNAASADGAGPGSGGLERSAHLLQETDPAPQQRPVSAAVTAGDTAPWVFGRMAPGFRAPVAPMPAPRPSQQPSAGSPPSHQQPLSRAQHTPHPATHTHHEYLQHQRHLQPGQQQPGQQQLGSAACQVSLERIASGCDERTGVFVGRLPHSLDPHRLLDELLAVPGAEIDMYYMPYDYAAVGTGAPGRGCAFLSLTSPESVAAICRRLRSGPVCGMEETVTMEYTPAPNADALLRCLLNLRYPHMAYVARSGDTRSRPVLLYVSGSLRGQVQPLDPSDVVMHDWPRRTAPGRRAAPAAATTTAAVTAAATTTAAAAAMAAATTAALAAQGPAARHPIAALLAPTTAFAGHLTTSTATSTAGADWPAQGLSPGQQGAAGQSPSAACTAAAAVEAGGHLPLPLPLPHVSSLLSPSELALVAHGMASMSYYHSGFLDALAQLMLHLTASLHKEPGLAASVAGGGCGPPIPPQDPLAPPLKSLLHALHALTSRPDPEAAACSQLADVCASVMEAWLPLVSGTDPPVASGGVASAPVDGNAVPPLEPSRPGASEAPAQRFFANLRASSSNPTHDAGCTAQAATPPPPSRMTKPQPPSPVASTTAAEAVVRKSIVQDSAGRARSGGAPGALAQAVAPLPPPEVLDVLVKVLAQVLTAAADHGPALYLPRLAVAAAALLRHYLPELRPRAACALLQPLVRLNVPSIRQLVRAVAPLLTQQPERLSPPSLVNLAWACARTGFRDDKRLVRALAVRAEQLLPQLPTAAAVQLFWALAVLRHEGKAGAAAGAAANGAGAGVGAGDTVYEGLLQLLRERYDLGARELLLLQEGMEVCRCNGLLVEAPSMSAKAPQHIYRGSSSSSSSGTSNSTVVLMDTFLRELLERAGQPAAGRGTAGVAPRAAASMPARGCAAAAAAGNGAGLARVAVGPSSGAEPRGGIPGGPGSEAGCLLSQQLPGQETGLLGVHEGDVGDPAPEQELEAASSSCAATALGEVLGEEDAVAGATPTACAPRAKIGQLGTGAQVADAAGAVVGFNPPVLQACQATPNRGCGGINSAASCSYVAPVGSDSVAIVGEDGAALAVRGLLQQIMVARQGLVLEETDGLIMRLQVSAALEAQAQAATGMVVARC